MSELNQFFEQILHTERSLSTRNSRLRKLKEEIQSCQEALQQVREETDTCRGELAVRNLKMVDQEVEAKLLAMRRSILEEQRNKLQERNQILAADLEKANRELDSQSHRFLEELREFGKSYDLMGSGYKHREEQARKRLSIVQDELLLLEAEVAEFDNEREEVEKLRAKLAGEKEALNKKRAKKEALQSQMVRNEEEVSQLEKEKQSCDWKLSTEPEIIRLQKDLEECRNCPEEKLYHSLNRELEDLQKLSYQQQMKEHLTLPKKWDKVTRKNTTSNRDKTHLTGGHSRKPGHYNPYTHEYAPMAGLYGTRRREREEEEGEEDGREEGWEEGGGTGDEWAWDLSGEGGQDEDGWDEELEAVDLQLASMEGSLDFIGQVEWEGEEEEEVEDQDECGVGGRERKRFEKKCGQKGESDCSEPFYRREEGKASYSAVRPRSKGSQSSLTTRTIAKQTKMHGVPRHTTFVVDSPLPAPKKQPGQSIYRAPGQHSSHQELPKTAKRVRFNY